MLQVRRFCLLSLLVMLAPAPLMANDHPKGMDDLLLERAESSERTADAEGDSTHREARGVLRTCAEAVLSSQIAARVLSMPL